MDVKDRLHARAYVHLLSDSNNCTYLQMSPDRGLVSFSLAGNWTGSPRYNPTLVSNHDRLEYHE